MVSYSLYFHIPFCTKKCDYCHFYVIPDQSHQKDLLIQAFETHWQLSQLPNHAPVSVYFGGGTPSLMAPEAMEKILSWITRGKETEITLEVNPENGSLEKMKAFKNAGINRVSIGAQTFEDHLLKQIGRTHSSDAIRMAVENTFKAGIENISLDLMYDLPDQTLEGWKKSLKEATSLPITHLSLYNLTIEPHTVFYKYKDHIQKKMPKDETSFQMLQSAIEKCQEKGFERYEISAFSKPGFYSKHNTGYWQDRPFLGFGPSAFSYWEGRRFRNIASLSKYAKALKEGKDPIDFQEKLPLEEKLKEKLAIGLRLLKGVLNEEWPASISLALAELEEKNLIEYRGNHVCLTEKGLLFHDTVAEMLFSYS